MAYSLNRNEVIRYALLKLGVDYDDLNSTQIQYISDNLSGLVNAWQDEGLYVWQVDWTTSTLTASSEVTGTDSKIYTCIRAHTSAAADKPITGANYSTYWIERGSTGGTWVTATAYTSIAEITMATTTIDIEKAFFRLNNKDYDLKLITKHEFAEIQQKSDTTTIPKYLWFEKKATPVAHIWPQPSDTTGVLHHMVVTNITESDDNATALDFNKPKYRALMWNLAKEIALDFGVTGEQYRIISFEADKAKRVLLKSAEETAIRRRIKGAF